MFFESWGVPHQFTQPLVVTDRRQPIKINQNRSNYYSSKHLSLNHFVWFSNSFEMSNYHKPIPGILSLLLVVPGWYFILTKRFVPTPQPLSPSSRADWFLIPIFSPLNAKLNRSNSDVIPPNCFRKTYNSLADYIMTEDLHRSSKTTFCQTCPCLKCFFAELKMRNSSGYQRSERKYGSSRVRDWTGIALAEDHDAPMHSRQWRSCRLRFKASVALKIPNFEDPRFKVW